MLHTQSPNLTLWQLHTWNLILGLAEDLACVMDIIPQPTFEFSAVNSTGACGVPSEFKPPFTCRHEFLVQLRTLFVCVNESTHTRSSKTGDYIHPSLVLSLYVEGM